MESQKIYQMGKMLLEKNHNGAFIKGIPDKTYYECQSEFEPEFSLSMPCRVIAIARYKFSSGFAISGHGTDTYDILCIFDGSVSVSTHGKVVSASKDEVLFLRSCAPFEIIKTGNESLDIVILRTSGLLASSYYEIITKRVIKPIYIKNRNDLSQLFEKIMYYTKYPSNSNNVLVSHTMSSIFVELYINETSTGERNSKYSHPQWFVETLDYIENHYGSDITVESLASRTFMSESYFYKVFREYTGLSPYQYLTKVRINHAQTLLNTTDLQVKFISGTVGFNSVNHFITHFKRITGVTPSEYRERKHSSGILQ